MGRVALTGDAAHAMFPMLGQGANQAFEDAMVMARELATNAVRGEQVSMNITMAFERFSAESNRMSRVSRHSRDVLHEA